jgi:hypothetical protein
MQLSELFTSENIELMRSEIQFSENNPRRIDPESKKKLKRGIKKFGLVGGIVVNKRYGYTLLSGHQRLTIMDEIQKYDGTPETDYKIRCDVVDLDKKDADALLILLNNPNAQGQWDFDKLAAIVPDIDYKDAGLTEADLSMIGLEDLYKTAGQSDTRNALDDLMAPVNEQHEQEKAERAAIREASKEAERLAQEEMTREQRVQHMKDVKQQVREQAVENAQNMDAFLVLSFSTFNAKAAFCQKFNYDPYSRTIKGEDFEMRCEPLVDDSFEDEE